MVLLSSLLFISCAVNKDVTPLITDNLHTTSPYFAYGTKPINLKIQSKCAQAPRVRIRNIENRMENYTILKSPNQTFYIIPSELMNVAANYLKEAYRKCRVEDDDNHDKFLDISLKMAYASHSMWSRGATIEINVSIPEIGYEEFYHAEDWTGKDHGAAFAYVMHDVLWQIINDPNVQDYILCREDINYLKVKNDKIKNIAEAKKNVVKSSSGKIKVVAGTYGQNCGVSKGNKTEHLASECNGKTKCEYVVNTFVIGDPYFGCAKNYIAEWNCGADQNLHTSMIPPEAGWSSTITLSCE